MKVVCFYFPEKTQLKSIADIFYGFTPQIALGERCIFLEIDQCKTLYTEEHFIAKSLTLFKQLEISPRIGIGPTLPLALAQCLYKTVDLKKLPLSFLKYFFNPFHLDEISGKLLNATLAHLHNLGLFNLNDFLNLPASALSSRFGKMGLFLHRRLQNSADILWPEFKPEEKIIEVLDFEHDVEIYSVEPVVFVLKSILEKLNWRLLARGLSLKRFEVRLLPHYPIEIDIALPQMEIKTLLQLFKDRAQALLLKKPLEGPISGLEVWVLESRPYSKMQKDLFFPKREEVEEGRVSLINRLSLKLGEKKVFTTSLVENYLPENTWKRETGPVLTQDKLPPRPLILFHPPIELFETSGCLRYGGEIIPIPASPQHEIILSEWWHKPEERIYFEATSNLGKPFWIYKTNSQYFLQGLFD